MQRAGPGPPAPHLLGSRPGPGPVLSDNSRQVGVGAGSEGEDAHVSEGCVAGEVRTGWAGVSVSKNRKNTKPF